MVLAHPWVIFDCLALCQINMQTSRGLYFPAYTNIWSFLSVSAKIQLRLRGYKTSFVSENGKRK